MNIPKQEVLRMIEQARIEERKRLLGRIGSFGWGTDRAITFKDGAIIIELEDWKALVKDELEVK